MAVTLLQNMIMNFLADWCTAEMRDTPGGGPGNDKFKALVAGESSWLEAVLRLRGVRLCSKLISNQ